VQRFFSRFLIKRAFQNISFVSLRDTESALQLQKAGIKNKNIVQTTDAVFLLPKKRSVKKRGTLLMLRGDANVAPDLINHIIPLLPKPVRCVAMDAVDASYCYKLDCRQLEIADADQLINTVANTKFVVSGRLHGGLAALSQNTSMLMFASAPKICNFFNERDLGDLVCDEAISKAAVTRRIKILKKNFSKTEKRLASALTQEKKIAKDILPYFLQKR
jgi:polysaccharide pyruvyl transferase WcaK-like protein